MNRVAIVTGAARGINAAVVRQLSAEGWDVVAVDRCADDSAVDYPLATEAELKALVDECSGPGRVLPAVADVRDQEAIDAAVALAVREFGALDAAVAGAGVMVGGDPLWGTSDAVYDASIGVNLTGVWRLARAAVPALLDRPEPRHGRFVAVASAAAVSGMPRLSAYSAAKAGVLGIVRALAAELRGTGVTANAVCPGSTATAMLEASARIYGLTSTADFAAQHLSERLIEPEEMAEAITWLCGEHSSAITGAVVPVDAGLTT